MRLDDGHLPRPARRPRRRRRARHAARRDRRDRQGVPAHPGPRRPGRRCATCPSCGPPGSAASRGSTCCSRLVERLDGLPRHIAVHPCGVLLSDATLLDRTPVEASFAGLPDEPVRQGRRRGPRPAQARRARHPDAVLDGPRRRPRSRGVDGVEIDLDDEEQVPLRRPGDVRADPSRPSTLGCFQIESPGQRELVGKSGLETFEDIITDISLFRPGPGQERHGHARSSRPSRAGGAARTSTTTCARSSRETNGVVVFHEQVHRDDRRAS